MIFDRDLSLKFRQIYRLCAAQCMRYFSKNMTTCSDKDCMFKGVAL